MGRRWSASHTFSSGRCPACDLPTGGCGSGRQRAHAPALIKVHEGVRVTPWVPRLWSAHSALRQPTGPRTPARVSLSRSDGFYTAARRPLPVALLWPSVSGRRARQLRLISLYLLAQPYSQQPRTPTVGQHFKMCLRDPVKFDL